MVLLHYTTATNSMITLIYQFVIESLSLTVNDNILLSFHQKVLVSWCYSLSVQTHHFLYLNVIQYLFILSTENYLRTLWHRSQSNHITERIFIDFKDKIEIKARNWDVWLGSKFFPLLSHLFTKFIQIYVSKIKIHAFKIFYANLTNFIFFFLSIFKI